MAIGDRLTRARRLLRLLFVRWRTPALLAVSLLAAALIGMHGHSHATNTDTRGESPVFKDREAKVEIRDHAFHPGNLVVPAGTTVTWINRDPVAHTATALDGSFDTALVPPGGSVSITVETPGAFDYSCLPHPHMFARLTVTDSGPVEE
ncbi:MAG: cupredoxin domain-containing protein [Dehalococcoidia bacterium]